MYGERVPTEAMQQALVRRGEVLRALRIKDGYSIAAFAAAVETVPSHISNIEAGRRGANPALTKRMAMVLNVPMSVLEVYVAEAA